MSGLVGQQVLMGLMNFDIRS